MEFADDRYRFVLDRPIVDEPGKNWIYSGGAVALIGAIIERGTGKRLPEFAAEALFEPLGIADHEWFAGKDGAYSAAAGLRLSTHSLLKIGMMMVDRGMFAGQRIVSESWIDASWRKLFPIFGGTEHYGYLWYMFDMPVLGAPRQIDRRLRQRRPAAVPRPRARDRLRDLLRPLRRTRPMGHAGPRVEGHRAQEPRALARRYSAAAWPVLPPCGAPALRRGGSSAA